jgi:ATP-binding cassette subfamily C (CFTR/MRP) protein 1
MTANFPTLIAPLVLFAAYAAQASLGKAPPLTAAKAFTSLALIQLMIGPSQQLIQGLISMFGASGCIVRMEKFLLESTKDERQDRDPEKGGLVLLDGMVLGIPSDVETIPISMIVSKGEVVMISGTVGSGKSTFLKVVLGERNPSSGNISISTTRIGYCAPKPWLRNTTIKNNITSSHPWDQVRFNTILHICDLETDLDQMPDGDETLVGSRGVVLSGGQKHRIALARALYARCEVLLLDDPFSSLDGRTRRNIASRLFGVDGFVRKHKITVIFVSHESKKGLLTSLKHEH